jgi:DNA-binding response OmpR family regulator
LTVTSRSESGFSERPAAGARTTSIVLCDSDPAMAAGLLDAIEGQGIRTTWCRDGASALLEVGALAPSVLVVADQIAGAVSAADVVATVRDHTGVPVLVGADPHELATARSALTLGGSAVIARPYDATAIMAFAGKNTVSEPSAHVVAGPLTVNSLNHEVRVRGKDIVLTRRELDVLVYLMRRGGRVASSDQISAAVWGHRTDTNTVAVHIKRLRAKLGSDVEHGPLIRTIRGAGYRLAPSICN